MVGAVEAIRSSPGAAEKNRTGVLLSNRSFVGSTKTLTHTLWALFNVLLPHTVQVVALSSLPCQSSLRGCGLEA